MVILNVLFSWLVQAGYLAGNPLALSRQRTRRAAPRITRYLEPGLWQEVKDFIASMPQDTARDRAHYHRVRWLFTLLYLGGLRIAEAGGNTMGQFFVRRDADGTMRWWLTVHGKGDRERLIPATRELMAELTRYRQSFGMTALPSPGEATPLVLPVGKTAGSTGDPTRKKTGEASHRPLTRAALHTDRQGRVCRRRAPAARTRRSLCGPRRPARAGFGALAAAYGRFTHGRPAGGSAARTRQPRACVDDDHEPLPPIDDDRRRQEADEKHRIEW